MYSSDESRWAEVLQILDSEHLGYKSRISQSDIPFMHYRMKALQKLEKWEDARQFALDLLLVPDGEAGAKGFFLAQDNWRTWELLVTATEKIGDAG